MDERDPRIMEYEKHSKYRNFKKIKGYTDKLSHSTHFVFSNGKRKIFASGGFEEEALIKIFDQIDKYYTNVD